MDLPFGDFFQNYTFADQALTSTDLLASNTDPDFMYELVSVLRAKRPPGTITVYRAHRESG